MLAGVRIADRSAGGAPLAGRLLGELGGDVRESWALDEADALIAAGRPSELRAAGLEPTRLLDAHPRLIVAAVTPFGLDGPRAEWRACDMVAQALGGMLLLNGLPAEPPLRALGAQAHNCAGLQAALGIALALLARERSGRGQIVDVSVHEAVVASLEHVTGLFHERGAVAQRQGSSHWSGGFRVGTCADGPVLLSHLGDWTALVEWLKGDGAAGDLSEPHWADDALRRAHAAHVFEVLDAWARRYRVDDLVAGAALRRLPFAPVWPLERAARQSGASGPWLRFAAAPPAAAPGSLRRAPAPPDAGILHGVRVLDFSWVVAGPLATRVLSDFGAEVIKVEHPDAPDGPGRRGAMFGNLNRGKASLALDLRRARGRDVARALIRRCDIVVDNFSPRVMENWELDPEAIAALNPSAIAVHLSGFGRAGSRDRVAYAPTIQAMAGFTWHMRHPGGAPAGLGFAYADAASGYATALAIASALWHRARTGCGSTLDVAQIGVVGRLLAAELAAAPAVPHAARNRRSGEGAPHGVYRCRDRAGERWCAIAAGGDREWSAFAAAVSEPWTADSRFATAAGRRRHAAELDAHIAAWARARDAEEIASTLQSAGIAAGALADAADLCERDPQLAARTYFARAGVAVLDGPMPRLGATPGRIRAPAPRLGEHGAQVLGGVLGLDGDAIADLAAAGAVRFPEQGDSAQAVSC
ncbi:MAG: CoA transferase [Candidatus Binatia bacterium]